jgi:hypothetical protein
MATKVSQLQYTYPHLKIMLLENVIKYKLNLKGMDVVLLQENYINLKSLLHWAIT